MKISHYILAGVDYSICSPCLCIFEGGGKFSFKECNFHFLTDTKKYARPFIGNVYGELFSEWAADIERFSSIADWGISRLKECHQIAIEGYAYSATGKIFNLAENMGILKYKIYSEGIPFTIYPPTEIKKISSGRGNSDKNSMHEAFVKDTGIDLRALITPDKRDVGNPVSDIVDSYFICKKLHIDVMSSML